MSGRDPVFYRRFWKEIFSIQGVNLFYSSAYHPQTDGQTGIVNKCIENYHDWELSKTVGEMFAFRIMVVQHQFSLYY
jgi:hypothetical protein